LLYEVTISGLEAIQADPFKGGYQLGQCRAKLAFVLAHQGRGRSIISLGLSGPLGTSANFSSKM